MFFGEALESCAETDWKQYILVQIFLWITFWNHCNSTLQGMEYMVSHVCLDNTLQWRGWEIWKSHISPERPIPAAQVDFYNNIYYHKSNGTVWAKQYSVPAQLLFFSFWHQHSLSPGDLRLHPLVLVGLWSWRLIARPAHPAPPCRTGGHRTQPLLSTIHFSLVTGIGPRGRRFIKSIGILPQQFGIRGRRTASSAFLKTSCKEEACHPSFLSHGVGADRILPTHSEAREMCRGQTWREKRTRTFFEQDPPLWTSQLGEPMKSLFFFSSFELRLCYITH